MFFPPIKPEVKETKRKSLGRSRGFLLKHSGDTPGRSGLGVCTAHAPTRPPSPGGACSAHPDTANPAFVRSTRYVPVPTNRTPSSVRAGSRNVRNQGPRASLVHGGQTPAAVRPAGSQRGTHARRGPSLTPRHPSAALRPVLTARPARVAIGQGRGPLRSRLTLPDPKSPVHTEPNAVVLKQMRSQMGSCHLRVYEPPSASRAARKLLQSP